MNHQKIIDEARALLTPLCMQHDDTPNSKRVAYVIGIVEMVTAVFDLPYDRDDALSMLDAYARAMMLGVGEPVAREAFLRGE